MKISPADLTFFQHGYAAIAAEMGAVLCRTAFSPNIKERRDYSCAVFDAGGRLLAQAAHIPVHLGALPRCARAVLDAFPALSDGDVVMLNDPFGGGTHLPDITLASPVFDERTGQMEFLVLARAHHADVGGIAPGSLPPSANIFQEGLRIPPVRVVRRGEVSDDLMAMVCANSRTPVERRGDMRAQLHAQHTGVHRLRHSLARHGAGHLRAVNAALIEYAERLMRSELSTLPAGEWSHEEFLEGTEAGQPAAVLRCRLRLGADGAEIDLRESDDALAGSLNATVAITESAVTYAFLCLLFSPQAGKGKAGPPINAGSFLPIRILTRPGSLLHARWPSAVAGGNVETSQRIVDVVLGALSKAVPFRIPAQGQGTMNNLTLGGLRNDGSPFAYYETLGGGMGASQGHDGARGIHVHMTNTLNTPVEALEFAYPFRVHQYALRDGSGGAGLWRGGDGLVREWVFGTPVELSLLTERRLIAPRGMQGGGPGACGRNVRVRADGTEETLPSKGTWVFAAGERLRLETPGGGGFGA
jgi:N-methylhydantoinase B